MEESQNNETTHEIEAIVTDVINDIITEIDYELMEEKLKTIRRHWQ